MTLHSSVADAIRKGAADRRALAVELRRALHEIPELAFQEVETTRFISRFCASRSIPFHPLPSGTGGVAVVGSGPGPALLLRADLDALPVEEQTGAPYRSRHAGLMHACGHDAHIAILLAAADALASGDAPAKTPVVCFFQPAEEGPGGCLRALQEGLLVRHPSFAAVALHVWPGLPTGTVGVSPGPLMAGMDRIGLTLRGRGGHGAYPHACVDPIVMAAEVVLSLQTVVSRGLDPLSAGLLTLGTIHGGTAANIIPDSVQVEGTIRFFAPEVRSDLLAGVRRVAAGVSAAHGGSFDLSVDNGYPVTQNDPAVTSELEERLRETLGTRAVVPARQTMGAEDMAYLFQHIPGCYLQLGCGADPAETEPLHSPRFALDEQCLGVGVQALLTAAAALGDFS